MSMMEQPLVIETGETFLTDTAILRFIRLKCGDAVADYITTRIDTDEMPVGGSVFLKRLKETLVNLSEEIDVLDADIVEVMSLIEGEEGLNKQ